MLADEGHDVAIIDESRYAFQRLGKDTKCKTFTGHALDEDVLLKAGVDKADAFVACTQGDNTNIMAMQVVRENWDVPRIGGKINDPIRSQEYYKMGYFTITECKLLAGAFNDWIHDQRLRAITEYLREVPTPK